MSSNDAMLALMNTDFETNELVDPTVRCSTCEAVCCRLIVVLMPDDKVPARFVNRDDRGLEVMAKSEDGWCAALNPRTMRCSIYEQRPAVCREFAMGGRACKEERAGWFSRASREAASSLIGELRGR